MMNILLLNYDSSKNDKYNILNLIRDHIGSGDLDAKVNTDGFFINMTKFPMYPPDWPQFPLTIFMQKIASLGYHGVNIKITNDTK